MGTSQVGNMVIRYDIRSDANGNPKELKGHINNGVDTIATYNCTDRGVMGFSISVENELTLAQRRAIVEQLLDDTDQIFASED